jgi:lambda family phage portal protein
MPRARRALDRAKQLAGSVWNGFQTGLDQAIYAVAPSIGSRRLCARRLDAIAELQAKTATDALHSGGHWYPATAPDPLRADRWMTSRLSADSYLELGLNELRDKCRSLACEFPFMAGAIDGRVDNVVGTGLKPQSRILPVDGLITQAEADKWNKELEDLWEQFAEYAGGRQKTFADIQEEAYRAHVMGGDSLTVHSSKPLPNKPVPLHCSVVDAIRIETPFDQTSNPLVRMGVHLDADGDPIGFHVRHTHPGDNKRPDFKFEYFEESRACFLMRRKWPDQHRGIPWAAPAAVPARDYQDWTEAEITKAQMAAMIGVIISVKQDPLRAARERATGALGNQRQEQWNPGQILYRTDAEKVDFLNPNHPSTTFGMFAEWQLLAVAAALDWPFGWLVKDRRRATYSAGRLEEIDGGVRIRTDQQLISRRLNAPTWRAFVAQCFLMGKTSIRPELIINHFALVTRHVWIPQPRPWVDPKTEVEAAVMAKDNNIGTLSDILGGLGKDDQDVLKRRVAERQFERDNDIVPPDVMIAQAQFDMAHRDPAAARAVPEKTKQELREEYDAAFLAACAS